MKILRGILAAVSLAVLTAAPALAQETPEQAYKRLDIWLRAGALNQRCNVLHYFEARRIAASVRDAARLTPEGDAALEALGSPAWPAADAAYDTMMAAHRKTAGEAVTDAECTQANPDILSVRRAYMRPIFKHLIGGYESYGRKTDPAGRQAVADDLLGLISSLYGNSAQTLMQTLIDELVAEKANPDSQWAQVSSEVDDTLWAKRLQEKGYVFAPVPEQLNRYRAVKSDGSGEFPATFRPRVSGSYYDKFEAEVTIDVSIAEGWTDDGRFVVLLSKDAANWGVNTLRADLLVQPEPGRSAWEALNWRDQATAYTADQPEADACPADFCFIFPAEVTEAIGMRHASGEAYNYELYIAPGEMFPIEPFRGSALRERYFPPALPEEAGAGR